ncbi:transaldolase [Trueperella bialowiezensis]|uniref:Transaldolase n=1 Tax=Trueperella bialowiezensis TaxID=312285 RepID=A0A3S4VEH8_9ACTO|nr:transaldolase [Trueperella bialowiezensis]VEI12411.1 Transaldolase [Trueperella bialowiezensis]
MSKLYELSDLGVSIWLDDLSRDRLNSGNLSDLINNHLVSGVTTNPTIFEAAISDSAEYRSDVSRLADEGLGAEEIIAELTTADVRRACDLFTDLYDSTGGYNGRVSIEVDPRLARHPQATLDQAKALWAKVDRPNAMIKIPATKSALPAIRDAIAEGISVNVTLIFSLERYQQVIDAYLSGLELAEKKGLDLTKIHSVASFFVSRVDTEIDERLEKIGGQSALEMRGKAGVANARAAYGVFLENFVDSVRFRDLEDEGANIQRPLFASTSVKNPDYSPTMYVDQLVARHVINTMPESTLWAVKEQADLNGDTIRPNIEAARNTLDHILRLGIDLEDVFDHLEDEGIERFNDSWEDLVHAVQDAMGQ